MKRKKDFWNAYNRREGGNSAPQRVNTMRKHMRNSHGFIKKILMKVKAKAWEIK
jgi:hypothetical protein